MSYHGLGADDPVKKLACQDYRTDRDALKTLREKMIFDVQVALCDRNIDSGPIMGDPKNDVLLLAVKIFQSKAALSRSAAEASGQLDALTLHALGFSGAEAMARTIGHIGTKPPPPPEPERPKIEIPWGSVIASVVSGVALWKTRDILGGNND